MEEAPQYLKTIFRRSLMEEDKWGQLAANGAYKKFNDLKFYVFVMKDLVDSQERAEIDALEVETSKMDEDEKNDFLVWHYPFYWDQTVRGLFCASTVITIYSFWEITLTGICKDIDFILNKNDFDKFKQKQKQSSSLKICIDYCNQHGGFEKIAPSLWNDIDNIREIRNTLVHSGLINSSNKHNKIIDLISNCHDLRELHGFIKIENGYLLHCLECTDKFLSYLSDEMSKLCKRQLELES